MPFKNLREGKATARTFVVINGERAFIPVRELALLTGVVGFSSGGDLKHTYDLLKRAVDPEESIAELNLQGADLTLVATKVEKVYFKGERQRELEAAIAKRYEILSEANAELQDLKAALADL